jgi:hypothetical protein
VEKSPVGVHYSVCVEMVFLAELSPIAEPRRIRHPEIGRLADVGQVADVLDSRVPDSRCEGNYPVDVPTASCRIRT